MLKSLIILFIIVNICYCKRTLQEKEGYDLVTDPISGYKFYKRRCLRFLLFKSKFNINVYNFTEKDSSKINYNFEAQYKELDEVLESKDKNLVKEYVRKYSPYFWKPKMDEIKQIFADDEDSIKSIESMIVQTEEIGKKIKEENSVIMAAVKERHLNNEEYAESVIF